MEDNYNKSRIQIQFGEAQSEVTFAKLKIHINKEKAQQQLNFLNQQMESAMNPIECDKSLVIALSCQSQNQEPILNKLNSIFESQSTSHLSEAEKNLRDLISDNKAFYKSSIVNGKIYLSFSPGEILQEMAESTLEMILGSGCEQVIQTQDNYFEIAIKSSRNFSEIVNDIQQGIGLGAALLEQSNLELKLQMHKDLVNSIKPVLDSFDEQLSKSPFLLFLTYFQSIESQMKFNNPSELDQLFKQYLFTPKVFRQMSNDQRKLKNIKENLIQILVNCMEKDLDLYFTYQDLGMIHLQICAPEFTKVVSELGEGVSKCLN